MHVPDGFLAPQITIPITAAAVPLWVLAARRHFGASSLDALPLLGSMSALAFVLQTLAIPIPGGTSVHVVGMALLAIAVHPLAAFACESLVLVVQALLLGAGGVTVLGVNALAMGLIGPLAGWAVFHAVRRLSPRAAAFAAGWTAVQASALAVAAVLGLQHAIAPGHLPAPFAVTLAATMIPSLAVTGVVEGLYTVFALSLLGRARLHGLA